MIGCWLKNNNYTLDSLKLILLYFNNIKSHGILQFIIISITWFPPFEQHHT